MVCLELPQQYRQLSHEADADLRRMVERSSRSCSGRRVEQVFMKIWNIAICKNSLFRRLEISLSGVLTPQRSFSGEIRRDAYIPRIGVHLLGVHLLGVHLIGMHLAGSTSQAGISEACIS